MSDSVIAASLTLDGNQAEQSLGSIKKQLKEASLAVIEMSEKFGATSTQAIEAAKSAAKLKDSIADSKTLVDAFNPDKKFNAFAGALGTVTGGFAALQGAMGLLGIESENVQKSLLKVQSALAISQGLNQIMDSVQGVKTFGKILVDTLGKSGLIGIAVAGVALLGAKLLGLFDGTKKLTEAQKAYNDTIKEYKQAAADATQKVAEVRTAFELARKGLIKKDEALEQYNTTLGDALGKTNDFATAEKNLADKADSYIKITGLKAQANALFAISAQKSAEALLLQNDVLDKVQSGNGKALGVDFRTGLEERKKQLVTGADEINKLASGLITQAQSIANKSGVTTTKPKEVKTGGAKADTKEDPRIQAEKDANEEIVKLKNENFLRAIEDESKRKKEEIRIAYEAEQKKIKNLIVSSETKEKLLRALSEKNILDIKEVDKKVSEEKAKIDKEALTKLLSARNEANLASIKSKQVTDQDQLEADYVASLKSIELLNATEKEKAELVIKAKTELNKKIDSLNIQGKKKLEDDYADSLKSIELLNITEKEKAELIINAKIELSKKIDLLNISGKKKLEADYADSLKSIELSNLIEKEKTALILQARINLATEIAALELQQGKDKAEMDYNQSVAEIEALNVSEIQKGEMLIAAMNTRAAAVEQVNRDLVETNAQIEYDKTEAEIIALEATQERKTELLIAAKQKQDSAIDEYDSIRLEKQLEIKAELDAAELSEQDLKLQQLDDWYKKRLEIVSGNEELTAQLIEQYEKRKTAIGTAEGNARIMTAQFVANQLEIVAGLIGKQTAAGKVLAIASATISTYLAAAKALAGDYTAYGPAGPFVRIATVASTIALGLKQVKEIVKVQVPGGGGGSVPSAPSLSTGSISAPVQPQAPQQQTTRLDQASLSQIGNATVRAFIVESDVTNNQERIRRLNRAARLG